MKIRLARKFQIQVGPREVKTYTRGEYSVPSDMPKHHAERAVAMRKGRVIHEKAAPETKVVTTKKVRKKVAKKTVRRRSTGTKPKS